LVTQESLVGFLGAVRCDHASDEFVGRNLS